MKTNPADKIEQWELERLTPYARNARTHSAAQVAQLAASIREWGWTTPVLVSPDGGLIAGHGRLLAAQQLGLETVPVVIAEGWSSAKTRAYVLADNQLAQNAGWDSELLALELGELGELGFDLELTGFSGDDIGTLLNGWKSDIEGVEQHGDEMETIGAVLRIKIATSDRVAASEAIENALQVAGVAYEFG